MKCPSCLENFRGDSEEKDLFDGYGDKNKTSYSIETYTCPNEDCEQRIIFLNTETRQASMHGITGLSRGQRMIHPRGISRPNVIASDIPEEYLSDYKEACDVLSISAKASAALSRRILQQLLIDKGGAKKKDLFDQIGEVINAKQLPTRISSLLDGVRVIGNFAAHPLKSTNTGEIIDVEPGEAEINLEAVESLFDYYFTQERIAKERNASINEKLKEAGKPTLESAIKARKEKSNPRPKD